MSDLPDWMREFIAGGSNFADPDQLDLQSTFDEAGFDALAPIELECLIETETGRYPSAEEVEHWTTLGDVVASFNECVERKAA